MKTKYLRQKDIVNQALLIHRVPELGVEPFDDHVYARLENGEEIAFVPDVVIRKDADQLECTYGLPHWVEIIPLQTKKRTHYRMIFALDDDFAATLTKEWKKWNKTRRKSSGGKTGGPPGFMRRPTQGPP